MAFTTATGVDLSPAEAELRKAYTTLLAEVQRLGNDGFIRRWGAASLNMAGNPFKTLPAMPVLHIKDRGRRVEYGWFQQDKWETSGSKIATALGATNVKQSHDEVFIAGEALGWNAEKLVELLIHQIVHQFAHESSTTTHHSHSMGEIAKYIGYRIVEKHPTQGFSVWKDVAGPLATVIMTVAQSIDPAAFSIYRKDEGVLIGSGRMKQWTCDCNRPKVYSGGVLLMTCDKCQAPLMYSHKDRMSYAVYAHLTRKGLPANRIESWTCSTCNQQHDWTTGRPMNGVSVQTNYPWACFDATEKVIATGKQP